VLRTHANPLTAAEIQTLASREVPTIGIATIYRSLKSLASDGQIVSVEIPGQPPRYERADKGHHHHFLCRQCGEVYEIEKCVEGIKSIAPPRFQVDDHEITLYGVCGACVVEKPAGASRRRKSG